MENPNLDNIVLAILFAADEPLSARKIAAVIEDVTTADVKQAIDAWNTRADTEAWSIAIEQVAGGYRLATRSEYAPYVSRLYQGRRRFRLSRAGLESLAIIAYKQPITRAEIEAIRGVGCGAVIANLLERSLIEIVGKAKVLGAPFLYGTTPAFLEYLGLNSLKDLPSMEDLEALLASEAGEQATEGEETSAAASEEESMPALSDDTAAPRAASAMLGPRVDEPVNRPLYDEVSAQLRDAVDEEDEDALDSGDDEKSRD
jgi:segregation and condensation protein B